MAFASLLVFEQKLPLRRFPFRPTAAAPASHRASLARRLYPLASVRVWSDLSAWLHKWLHAKVV
jgi:hypothetical protein